MPIRYIPGEEQPVARLASIINSQSMEEWPDVTVDLLAIRGSEFVATLIIRTCFLDHAVGTQNRLWRGYFRRNDAFNVDNMGVLYNLLTGSLLLQYSQYLSRINNALENHEYEDTDAEFMMEHMDLSCPPPESGHNTGIHSIIGWYVYASPLPSSDITSESQETRISRPRTLSGGFTLAEYADVSNVYTSSENNPIRSRPAAHGTNDVTHNLNVMYRNCYMLIGGKLCLLRQFVTGEKSKIMVQHYTTDRRDTTTVEFNKDKHIFPAPELGWAGSGSTFNYIEKRPGTYLRGISEDNFMVTTAIADFTAHKSPSYNTEYCIKSLLDRKFHSIDECVKNKMPGALLSTELLLFLGKPVSRDSEKYFLMFAEICVGEFSSKGECIKLYTPFKDLKPMLQRVLSYEIK